MNQTEQFDHPETPWARVIDDEQVRKRVAAIADGAAKPMLGHPEVTPSGYEGEDELVIHYGDNLRSNHPDIPNREVYLPRLRRLPMGLNVDSWSLWRLPKMDPIEMAVHALVRPPRFGRRERRVTSYLFNHHHDHCAFFVGTSCAQAVMDVLDGPPADGTPEDEPIKMRRTWHSFLTQQTDYGWYEIWEGRIDDDPEGRSVFVIQLAPAAYSINKGIWWLDREGKLDNTSIRWDAYERKWDAVEIDGFTIHDDVLITNKNSLGEVHHVTVQPEPIKIKGGPLKGTLDKLTLDEDVLTHDLVLLGRLKSYHPAEGLVSPGVYDELLSVGPMPCWDARELEACITFLQPYDQMTLLTHLASFDAPKDELGLTEADKRNVEYMQGKGPSSIVDKIIEICDIQNEEYSDGMSMQVSIALTQLRRNINKIIAYQLAILAGESPDGDQRI